MENRTLNEHYAEIAAELIETEESLIDLKNSQVSIVYLSSTHQKKSREMITHAECEKISDKYKWGIPCDFTITVFEPNIEGFTEEQIKILLHHELLHIGVEFNPDGTETYFNRKHDLEDFKIIIDKYGTEWSKTE